MNRLEYNFIESLRLRLTEIEAILENNLCTIEESWSLLQEKHLIEQDIQKLQLEDSCQTNNEVKQWRFRSDMYNHPINGLTNITFKDAENRLNQLENDVIVSNYHIDIVINKLNTLFTEWKFENKEIDTDEVIKIVKSGMTK